MGVRSRPQRPGWLRTWPSHPRDASKYFIYYRDYRGAELAMGKLSELISSRLFHTDEYTSIKD